MKEDFHDCEADLVTSANKCALSVDGNYCQIFEAYREGEVSDILPEGIVNNGCVAEGELDLVWHGDIGDYQNIR